MQGLKVLVVAMGVLILVGVAVIGVTVWRRLSGPPTTSVTDVVLREPAGTRIVGIAALPDRMAVLLQGGGADRIRLLDSRTLQADGEVRLVP